MVKSKIVYRKSHISRRRMTRTALRRPIRCSNRSALRGHRRGPDDLSQALAAFGRAIRAHRRLARLAPSFFDSAIRDREAENRAEQRRWMATWEPYIAKAYGVEPRPPETDDELPRLPSLKIQREVDLKLTEREMCIIAGRAAMDRWRQRQPPAVMSWNRMVRLLKIGFDFGKLACGMEIINPVPEKIAYGYELTDLKRSYPAEADTSAVAEAPSSPPDAGGAGCLPESAGSGGVGGSPQGLPASPSPSEGNPPSVQAGDAGGPTQGVRCDAWSRWARNMRRLRS